MNQTKKIWIWQERKQTTPSNGISKIDRKLDRIRSGTNAVLNIREQKIEVAYAKDHKNIKLETSITTNGKDRLGDILDIYRERAIERAVELQDPRLLPLETAKALILADPIADLTIYTEDDLIVQGNSFIEKVLEFYEHADSGSVLMPHRYEVCNTNYPMKLWVDGPIVRQYANIEIWSDEEKSKLKYISRNGEEVKLGKNYKSPLRRFCS